MNAKHILKKIATLICIGFGLNTATAQISYVEEFSNNVGDLPLADYGWNVNYGSLGTVYDNTNTVFNNGFIVTTIAGGMVASGDTGSPASGWSGNSNLLWTSNISTLGININQVTDAEFTLRNNNTGHNNRLAISIDGSWYVTQTVYNNPGNTVPETFSLGFSDLDWNELSFVSGSNLSMGVVATLPSTGLVDGIGIYTDSYAASRARVENVSLNAIPEPETFALMVSLLCALTVLKRRLFLK